MKDLGASESSWQDQGIPQKQYEIAKKELADLRAGNPNIVWKNISEAINENIPDEINSIVDIGCASGYFYEVFGSLLSKKYNYSGYDYSSAMIKLAKENYPDVQFNIADVTKLPFDDKSHEFVFSNAVLEHVPEWKKGLLELCRVAGKYLVLSKMPGTNNNIFYTEQKEIYGGIPVFFNKFNKEEIIEIVLDQGFQLIHDRKTNPNPNNVYRIFVFERIS